MQPASDCGPPATSDAPRLITQTGVSGAAANAPGKSATPAPMSKGWPRLKLVGAAPSNVLVSTFTARLGGSPLFRDVQTGMVKDAVVAAHKVRQFEVECLVVPQTGGAR